MDMAGADISTVGVGLTDIEGAGGDSVVIPYLVGSLGAIYSVGKAYDTWKYWNDYKKNTGFSPRYPFRSGSMDYLKYGAGAGFSFSRLKKL